MCEERREEGCEACGEPFYAFPRRVIATGACPRRWDEAFEVPQMAAEIWNRAESSLFAVTAERESSGQREGIVCRAYAV